MQKVDGISEQLDFFRHFSVKNKKMGLLQNTPMKKPHRPSRKGLA